MTKNQKTIKKKTLILKRVLIITLIVAIAIAIFFFVRYIVDKKVLLDNGEQVIGVVEVRDVHLTTARSTSLTSRSINYSFTPKGSSEKVTQKDFYVSREEYEKYPVGSQIPVTYLPNSPSTNQPSVSLRHMSTMIMNFMYLFLAIVISIFSAKIVKRLQVKHGIKQPGWPFYFTSFAGFMAAFLVAAVLTVFISKLISLILS